MALPGSGAALFRGIGKNTESSSLCFDAYDSPHPVNEISLVDDDGDEVAVWQDEDLRVRLAAPDLLEIVEYCAMTLYDLDASKLNFLLLRL